MIILNAIYPATPNARFDADYYRDSHMPMCKRVLGAACTGIAFHAGLSGGAPGSAPPFVAIGTLYFDSLEDFQTAFPPKAAELMADIPNYTDITPVIQISDVALHDVPAGAAAHA